MRTLWKIELNVKYHRNKKTHMANLRMYNMFTQAMKTQTSTYLLEWRIDRCKWNLNHRLIMLFTNKSVARNIRQINMTCVDGTFSLTFHSGTKCNDIP